MTDQSELPDNARATAESVARASHGKLLALLIHQFRDIELAEDGLQDALLAAVDHWPKSGVPDLAEAWLLQSARNRIIDQLRRQQNFYDKLLQVEDEREPVKSPEQSMSEIPDERLRLIFTCCHPSLATQSQVALTLNTLCGLSTQQVASAFILPTTTMAQRLVRAKQKIKAAGIPYEVPLPEHLPEWLERVLSVIYYIFNEGYSCSTGQGLIDRNLCDEALRLAQAIAQLIHDNAEIWGLIALMLFHYSRFDTRQDMQGKMIDLENQKRGQWDRTLIERADKILMSALHKGQPGPYQIQASISAVHAHAKDFAGTDWKQIVMLYFRLEAINPNPVVSLNLAVALSYAEDPETGLSYLQQITDIEKLARYHPFHAARADLLCRAQKPHDAAEHYRKAIELCDNPVEKDYLVTRLGMLNS